MFVVWFKFKIKGSSLEVSPLDFPNKNLGYNSNKSYIYNSVNQDMKFDIFDQERQKKTKTFQ